MERVGFGGALRSGYPGFMPVEWALVQWSAGLLSAHEHLNRFPAFCQSQQSLRPLLLSVVSLPLACSAPRAAEIFINLDHSRSQAGSQGCGDEVGWVSKSGERKIGTVAYPLPLHPS